MKPHRSAAAIVVAAALTVTAHATAPATTPAVIVKTLLTLEEKPSNYFIIGVYRGFNLARTVDKQGTCWAPEGISGGSVAAMVRDEWRAHPDEYNDVGAEVAVSMVICTLWRPAEAPKLTHPRKPGF